MRRIISVVVSMLLLATVSIAVKPNGPSAVNGLNSKGQVDHLYLYEKDPVTWEVVEGGAWGKLSYSEDSFVFNGHGLEAATEYTLVRYESNAWSEVECLESDVSNNGGNINLAGDVGSYGNKVWLVLSSDVDCVSEPQKMTGWNPSEYLFEYALI